VATLPLFTVPVPKTVVPLEKVTDPVGAAVPVVCVTVAVKVTFEPTSACEVEGVAVMVRAVVVAFSPPVAGATVNTTGGEVEPAKLESPL
jgi:hypothetical protein